MKRVTSKKIKFYERHRDTSSKGEILMGTVAFIVQKNFFSNILLIKNLEL